MDATARPLERKLLPNFIYELIELSYSAIEFVKLSHAFIRHRPDVLYERENLFMLSGVWASRIFGLPYLLEVNSPLAEERKRYGALFWCKLAQWTEAVCWRNASVVLPVTEALAQHIRRYDVPDDRIRVTPNGVDLLHFSNNDTVSARKALGLQDQLVLGFVGYVREWHGLDRVVELLANTQSMNNAYFLIVGDGPARSHLEAEAIRLGVADRMQFTGSQPRSALPALIAAFDIALQPQVTPYASPLKLFEYMALARPIVAPAYPNILEILEDQHDAYLFDPDKEGSFAQAIEHLSSSEPLRKRLGQAAANKIINKDLTWRGNAARIAELARALIAGLPLPAKAPTQHHK